MNEPAPLSSDDVEAVVALWEDAGLIRPWNDPRADFARALASPASAVLGLREGDRLVGTAMVGDDGHRAWVYYLAVALDRRGQGLGRRLIAAAEDWAKARCAPKLHLMVRAENEAAAGFYGGLGYEAQPVTVWGKRLD